MAGAVDSKPQPADGATYAPKIKKEDGRLDWTQPARALWNRVRGLTPWPGAFSYLPGRPQPMLLKIWRADVAPGSGTPGEILDTSKTGIIVACGSDALRILVVQSEGGRRLQAHEFLAGHQLRPGQRFGGQ